jgi:class 3 adenylate cyclase
MDAPMTRYAEVGGAEVAYQVIGEKALDLVWCYALGAQVDLYWQVPGVIDSMKQLTDFARVIVFDRRGSGASDPLPLNAVPTWEALAEDLTAVLDAAGAQRAAILAPLETGPIAVLFAAIHPERVSHLILYNTTARYLEDDDYPIGMSLETLDSVVGFIGEYWGTDGFARMLFPSQADDPEVIQSWSRMLRASATRRAAAAQYSYFLGTLDVRSFLPLVQAPTLVMHSTESPLIPLSHGRFLADHISGATLVDQSTTDIFGETQPDMIEFLTGDRPVAIDRVLTTIVFTDIVGSTERVASIGDQRWHALLDSHDRVLREQVRGFKGREIQTTGDGFLLSFDGPARAIRCVQAIGHAVEHLGIEIRTGLHTGECEVRGDDLGGLAVHIAARVGALATSGEILVTGTLRDLVAGSGIEFDDRGEHELRGVPGTWKLYAVAG